MQQIERQWLLLKSLPSQSRPKSTDELWRQLTALDSSISKRTVERDLSLLCGLFPIASQTQGRTNLWYWASSAKMWLPGLSEDQALALHMVELTMRRLLPEASIERLEPYFEVARSALGTTGRAIGRAQSQKFRLLSSGVPRVARKLFNRDAARAVQEALLRDLQVQIDYWPSPGSGRTQTKTLATQAAVINPLALVQRDLELLLIYTLRDSSAVHFMPLRAIDQAKVTGFAVQAPPDFDIDAYLASGAIHFSQDLPLPVGTAIELSASFSPAAWARLSNTPLVASKKISIEADGRRRLLMPLRFSEELAHWLLSLGPQVEVHEPTALRSWVQAQLQTAAQRYQS